MPAVAWVLIALIGVAGGAAAVWWWKRSRLDEAELQRRSELRDATKQVRSVERAHRKAIKSAEKEFKQSKREYEQRIARAEAQLVELKSPTGRRLGGYRGVVVFQRQVTTPQGSGPLAGARATVDTAGALATKSRATLTRMAAGGVLLGPLGAVLSLGFKKHKEVDKRELYLLVEGNGFAGVVECPADDGMKAREFAAMLNSSAMQAAEYEAALPMHIEGAERELAAARAATAVRDQAHRQLLAVQNDEGHLEAISGAKKRVAELGAGQAPIGQLPPYT
jgi:hypothetical protein